MEAVYNIAFIIERYFEYGGLQRDMRRFARACADAGHEVTVFTGDWNGPADDLLKVELVDFSAPANHRRVLKVQEFARNLQVANRFDCIVGFSRVQGLDVHFCGDTCYKAKLKRNGKSWLSFLSRYRTYLNLEASVFQAGGKTQLLLMNQTERDTIQKLYGTESERLHLLPPGIDKARLTRYAMTSQQRSEFRRKYLGSDEGFIILTIGSSFDTKGIDRAIYAIAALPEKLRTRCHYIVIGKGDNKKFQSIADKAGIGRQISFTGGREDIGAFYYASNLLLHPARTENAGHTLLEAMICQLPVLVTEHCGYSPYVREARGGLLCPDPYDQTKLNEMLLSLLTDDNQRLQLGTNGFAYCQTADIYAMTDNVVRVVLDVAARKRVGK